MTLDETRKRLTAVLCAHERRIAQANARVAAEVAVIFDAMEQGEFAPCAASAAARHAVRRVLFPKGPIARVIEVVAEMAEVTPQDMIGGSREKHLFEARQLAIAVCLRHGLGNYSTIGRAFRRDHTSIMHAKTALEARMSPEIDAAIVAIAGVAGIAPQAGEGAGA
jgi:chromosomal replication initiation ATPase DnaA